LNIQHSTFNIQLFSRRSSPIHLGANYDAPMRILVVEDDPDMSRFIARGLGEHAYAVDVAATGEQALERATTSPYDAIILDARIPPPDGFEVCRMLRTEGNEASILMLTARDSLADRVEGLDSGADDYLVKPFEFPELLARLRALLRRRGVRQYPVLETADLRIDTRSHRVTRAGDELALTTKEYALLEFLGMNTGRVIGREEIAEHVWNDDFDPFSNLIEVYIGRLRKIVEREGEAKLIHTIRGAGYMLDTRPPQTSAP
jgi:two-component system copper resistance phosphate regulon response regulator CusR